MKYKVRKKTIKLEAEEEKLGGYEIVIEKCEEAEEDD